MGIQAYIKITDLTAVGATVKVTEHRCGDELEDVYETAEVVLPCGEVLGFHVSRGGDAVWIDANHWGDNRETHLTPLAALGVSWTES